MSDFRKRFGRQPDGRWAAPGRVNLIGEHVDYADGLCLPFALNQRTVAEVAARDDDRVRLYSAFEPDGWEGHLDEIGPGCPPGWPGYVAGVLWALRQMGHRVPGVDVLVGETVPIGAGLSSSAALECAVAVAVDELAGLGLGSTDTGRYALAAACRRAENEVVGAPTGGMDQVAALFGAAGHAVLFDAREHTARLVPLPFADEGLVVLVIDTRVRHSLADGQYAARREAVEQAAHILGLPSLREASLREVERLEPKLRQRARHVVTEIARVRQVVDLLEAGRCRDIGPVLDASHASLAEDFEVSCPELDLAVTTARAAGALGARMTGGGFGGSAIALVPVERVEAVTAAVQAAFTDTGMQLPRVFTAKPATGATRIA